MTPGLLLHMTMKIISMLIREDFVCSGVFEPLEAYVNRFVDINFQFQTLYSIRLISKITFLQWFHDSAGLLISLKWDRTRCSCWVFYINLDVSTWKLSLISSLIPYFLVNNVLVLVGSLDVNGTSSLGIVKIVKWQQLLLYSFTLQKLEAGPLKFLDNQQQTYSAYT